LATIRVFFTSDVHGSEICFTKFLKAADFYKANVLILGGDITGKMIIPIVQEVDGAWSADFLGTREIVNTIRELETLEKNIRYGGYYPYRTVPAEVERMQNDKKSQDELFSKVMVEGVRRWVSLAEERFRGTEVKCYISPGNDDRVDIDEVLNASSVVLHPEDDVVKIDDHHEMITTAWTNYTPWHSPREASEEELSKRLELMISKVQNMENCLFNLHCPPSDTPIDFAPELDENLKPKVTSQGGLAMIHVGSTAVRQAIEKHQPLLGLHGHIHESSGFVKIGRTMCINPGSEYGEGILRGAIINIDEKKVKSYMLTHG
jgi:Icc-related predicted phosphoesterase